MSLFTLLIYFCGSLSLCAALTSLTLKIALKRGWMVQPTPERWHKTPTALAGGCAIFASLIIFISLSPQITLIDRASASMEGWAVSLPPGLLLIISASLVFAMGLYDDFRNVPPRVKLICQGAATLFLLFSGYRLHWFPSQLLDSIVTLLWITGITNAFNLIDNMDGLCGGVSSIAAMALVIVFFPAVPETALIAMILAGVSAGFLIHNRYPAKIFMGDCGSQVLGFSIALLTVCSPVSNTDSTWAKVAVPLLIVLVPVLDTTLITVNRIRNGRKISTGGSDHTSHRLVLAGLSEKNAVFFLYGTGAVSGLAAILIHSGAFTASLLILIPLLLFVSVMTVYLSRLKILY